MTSKKYLTRTQLCILKTPRKELRRVTLDEKINTPGRFSLKGEYLIPKTIKKFTSRTAAVTISRFKDFLAGVSHSKASVERKAGLRGYKTAASEEQARKQIATKEKRSRRIVRRNLAAEKEGFKRGGRQRRAVLEFLNKKMAQHDRYLDTGRGRLDADEYRKTVKLAFEYFGDDERTQRLAMSYTITAAAA